MENILKLYENILKSVKEENTISSHITTLGKVRSKIEDRIVFTKIKAAIASLQNAHVKAGKRKVNTKLLRSSDRYWNQSVGRALLKIL